MDLEATLRTAVRNLRSDRLENEAQVKQAVILPVLRALGWDDADPASFKPEYAVGRGLVDYALLDRGKPRVFIEAKRTGAISADGEDQLFRYAAHQGVPLLVLTDGDVWALYLSMAEGLPSERRFFDVELQRANIVECAQAFADLLKRDRVVSGEARREAERRHEQLRNRLRARDGILSAWHELLNGPDEMLRDLLAEKVETDSGSKPDPEDVEAFLRGLKSSFGSSPVPPKPLPKRAPEPRRTQASGRVVGFVLGTQRVEAGSARRTLTELIQSLAKETPEFMERMADETVGKRRRLLARQRDDLYNTPHLVTHSIDLGNGWWMGTNLSQANIRKHIETACRIAGIEYGSQLTLVEK
ncbi:MAG: type I restriction endonuclease [Gammaproteobacteria bacterium]|nr:type I restriction endonuclease [Gammaproteobacteria bacterium]